MGVGQALDPRPLDQRQAALIWSTAAIASLGSGVLLAWGGFASRGIIGAAMVILPAWMLARRRATLRHDRAHWLDEIWIVGLDIEDVDGGPQRREGLRERIVLPSGKLEVHRVQEAVGRIVECAAECRAASRGPRAEVRSCSGRRSGGRSSSCAAV